MAAFFCPASCVLTTNAVEQTVDSCRNLRDSVNEVSGAAMEMMYVGLVYTEKHER